MRAFSLKIVTPNSIVFSGGAQRVIARTSEGDTGILYGHIDYTAVIEDGNVKILPESGEEISGVCKSGILTVKDKEVTILANEYTENK